MNKPKFRLSPRKILNDGIIKDMSILIMVSPEIAPGRQLTLTLDESIHPNTLEAVMMDDGSEVIFVSMPYKNSKLVGSPNLAGRTINVNWLVSKEGTLLKWYPQDDTRKSWLKDFHKTEFQNDEVPDYFAVDYAGTDVESLRKMFTND